MVFNKNLCEHSYYRTNQKVRELKLEPFKSSISNKMLIENIIDYIYLKEFRLRTRTTIRLLRQTSICVKNGSNVYMI
jgi:hypothetical protein